MSRFNRLTWSGFALAACGWLLLGMLGAAQFVAEGAGPAARLAADARLVSIAEMAIVSGLALAVIGVLVAGFGALDGLFGALLRLSAERSREAAQAASAELPADQVVERGRVRDRSYAVYGDGSVEIETLLGVRRFRSFEEVHEFIGA
ncbi:hypothetical protein [Propylenella binzhouense]|uniref:Uncharacterized protein n=1 Tax=Propylenella binzhouense TaxID=2555902 RepID=A0A964T2X4_9HYPH|nr:hypothetical protein [Propylenella binzhouense]MYZ46952.1 hypothetical protein [Propylenella binzhouense]